MYCLIIIFTLMFVAIFLWAVFGPRPSANETILKIMEDAGPIRSSNEIMADHMAEYEKNRWCN